MFLLLYSQTYLNEDVLLRCKSYVNMIQRFTQKPFDVLLQVEGFATKNKISWFCCYLHFLTSGIVFLSAGPSYLECERGVVVFFFSQLGMMHVW